MIVGQRVTRSNKDGIWMVYRVHLSNTHVDLCRVDGEGWAFKVAADTLTIVSDS